MSKAFHSRISKSPLLMGNCPSAVSQGGDDVRTAEGASEVGMSVYTLDDIVIILNRLKG